MAVRERLTEDRRVDTDDEGRNAKTAEIDFEDDHVS